MMNRIYLDHAATTAVSPEVLREMLPYMTECFGNAASIHGTGREAHRALDRARKQVAAVLGAQPQEIYFTSGGSESDNWAVKGVAWAARGRGKHVITSAVEHHAVLNACAWLEGMGFEVTRSSANFLFARHPLISGEELYRRLKENGILVRHFGAERIRDYNRISIGTEEQMDTMLRVTEKILKDVQEAGEERK